MIHIILCNTAVHMYKETENINIYLKKIIIHIQCCFVFLVSSFLCVNMKLNKVKSKENRIYIRVEFTWKKCKSAILLLCFHTAGVLHTFVLYNLLGPGTSFYIKSKINIERKPNYEIGWFHNWPMTLCLSLYKWWFSVITINQLMFFFHLIHFIKFI